MSNWTYLNSLNFYISFSVIYKKKHFPSKPVPLLSDKLDNSQKAGTKSKCSNLDPMFQNVQVMQGGFIGYQLSTEEANMHNQ